MKRIIYAALACLTFASCEDFLDKQPIEQIGTDEYFKDEASLEKYTNGFLNSYTPSSGDVTRGDGNCDIIEVKQTSSYLYQPVWNSSLQGGWSNSTWNFVYYINTFLERMHEAQGVSEAAFAHYEGTARFWRAWNYFELVKTFGGVPWYDHVVRSDSEEDLYKPRDSREYVMERVLEDLNYACEHCYTSEAWVDNQKINRYIALAIKSRICLFEGTYRKYHRVDPSTGKAWDPEYNKDNKWLREAAERGIESIGSVPDAFKVSVRKDAIALFEKHGIFNEAELHARYEINMENLVKKIQIESRVLADLAANHIVPTAIRYQNILIQNVKGLKDILPDEYADMAAEEIRTIRKIARYVKAIRENTYHMVDARKKYNAMDDIVARATGYSEEVQPYLDKIRHDIDKLELIVDDELWPLPKYREMMSIN